MQLAGESFDDRVLHTVTLRGVTDRLVILVANKKNIFGPLTQRSYLGAKQGDLTAGHRSTDPG